MLGTGVNDLKRDVGRKEEEIMNNDKDVYHPPFLKVYPYWFLDIASKKIKPLRGQLWEDLIFPS